MMIVTMAGSLPLQTTSPDSVADMQDAAKLAKLTVFEEKAFFNAADPLGVAPSSMPLAC